MIPTIFFNYSFYKNIYRFGPKIEPQTCFFFSYGPTLNPQIKELKKIGDNKTRKKREEHGFEMVKRGPVKGQKGTNPLFSSYHKVSDS